MSEVIGWRIYSLDDAAGTLRPPVAERVWPHLVDPADTVDAVARCLTRPHAAPAADCACGLRATVDLRRLVDYGTATHPVWWPRGMLWACGVLARVRLLPPFQPGHAMGRDDPWTTWRGARAELLDLHLGGPALERAEQVERLQGCPVYTYPGERWWRLVELGQALNLLGY